MAEASGLLLGAMGLASLFTTCVELFDRFELGRNYIHDYELACTKLYLLKARLSGWGISLTLESPGHEHPGLRERWPQEKDIIARSLFGIRDIVGNASLLVEKYNLTPARSRSLRSGLSQRRKGLKPVSAAQEPVELTTTTWSFLRKRTVWAVHDKQKFDDLIQNISFLIENLEKVKSRIEMSTATQETVSTKSTHVLLASNNPKPNNHSNTSAQNDNDHTDSQPPGSGSRPSDRVCERHQAHYQQQSTSQKFGNVYVEKQNVVKGVGVMGNIGETNERHLYMRGQSVAQNGFGVMGNVSAKAAGALRTSTTSGRKDTDPGPESSEDESGTE